MSLFKNSGTNSKVQPSPERLSVQLNYMERRYEEALTKVLEQNREILTSVASIKTELRTLRDKVESLEVAATAQEEPIQPRVNGSDARSTPGGSSSPAVGTYPGPGQFPGAPFPGHHGYFNPYASAFNPYMMTDPAMAAFMNPALSQMYANMFGALNPAVATPPLGLGQAGPSGGDARNSLGGTPLAGNSFLGNPLGANNQSFGNVHNGPGPSGLMQTPEPARPTSDINRAPTSALTITPVSAAAAAGVGSKSSTTPSVSFTFQTAVAKSAPKDLVDGGMLAKPTNTVPFGTSAPVEATPTAVQAKGADGVKPFQFGAPSTSSLATSGTATFAMSTPSFSFGGKPATSSASAPTTTTPTAFQPKETVLPSVAKTVPTQATPTPAPKQAEVKSNLFGSDTKTNTSSPFGLGASDQASTPSFGFGAAASGPSFSSLASTSSSFADQNKISGSIFGGAKPFSFESPKPMFGGASTSATNANESPSRVGNPEEGEDDFVPTAVFEPVIPLPPLVEVRRGDENENVLFAHRAKLLRYVKNDAGQAEWKERGLGEIKILQDKENPKKIRVVMWREKVHKIACNHWVTKDIKVTNYQGNPKNLMWTALDFADEGGAQTEIFVCRFREEEKGKEFKAAFEKAIALVDTMPTTPKSDAKKPEVKSSEENATAAVPLSQLFKKPEGTWNCESCYTENKKESFLCVACQAPNPKAACSPNTKGSDATTTAATTPQFSFGFGASPASTSVAAGSSSAPAFSFGFGNQSTTTPKADEDKPETKPVGTTASSNSFLFGASSTPAKTDTSSNLFSLKSNVGVTPTQSNFGQTAGTTETKKDSTPSFDFGKKSEAMPSFASLAGSNTPATKPFSGSFTFGSGPVTPMFGSVNTPVSTTGTAEGRDDETGEDEFVPTAEFAPVVPLPPLVDVKRGDEDEKKLFSHRAKLLRFTKNDSGASEWKERGVGDIKLLQAKDNEGKIRVVMWREKVHKIACNHWVTKDMKVTNYQNNPKNLMWTAYDFADVEEGPKSEIFVCRFGNEEKAQEFKTEFEKAIELVGKHEGTSSRAATSEPQASTSASVKSLAEFCKKAEGDWTCSACYCTNSKDKASCISCATPKPGSSGDSAIAGSSNTLTNVNLASSSTSQEGHPHPLDGPTCRGCEPEKFDFQKLDGRQVPVFEDIPKPTKNDSSELKQLLSKPTGTASSTSATPTTTNAFSNFTFSFANSSTPASTFATPSATTPPTFSFTPNFSALGASGSVFGTPMSTSKEDAVVPKTVKSLEKSGTVNGNEEEGEEDEDDGGEEEEEEEPMFVGEGRGYFREQGQTNFKDYGEGEVKIVYDGDRFCARFFFMANDSEDYIDHIVSMDTSVESIGDNTYEWNCVHYDEEGMPVKGRVKIAFPDPQSFDQFSSNMFDAVELAQQTNITEADLEAYPDGAE